MSSTEIVAFESSGAAIEHNVDIWDHQITFEIPSNVDLERIKNLDNFTTLLHRAAGFGEDSVNLADVNSDNVPSVFGKWYDSVDYHIILNYLWIGVVTSLVIMSVVFVIFSCYFYRKFKEWKKCNKDIRSQLPNDLYPPGVTSEDSYYQMESPPCYTIATGLPSYDDALLQAHFTFGMRFVLPWESPARSNNYQWEGSESANIKEIENGNNWLLTTTTTKTTTSGGAAGDEDEKNTMDYVKDSDCTEVVVIS